MRNKIIPLLGALVLGAGTAGAQQLTFDPFPGIPAGVSVNYFANTRGLLAALPTLSTQALTATASAIPGGGNALLLWDDPSFPELGALFSFSSAISFFSAVGNDFGGTNPTDNERVYLTAFDAAGNVVGTSITQGPYAQPNLQFANVSGANIAYVAFTWDTDLGYYAVDDVDWRTTVVPEPSTYALLATGMAGLVALARRRRQA